MFELLAMVGTAVTAIQERVMCGDGVCTSLEVDVLPHGGRDMVIGFIGYGGGDQVRVAITTV